jgi:hypothetical protein
VVIPAVVLAETRGGTRLVKSLEEVIPATEATALGDDRNRTRCAIHR